MLYYLNNKKKASSFLIMSLLVLAYAKLDSLVEARGDDDESDFDDSDYVQPHNHDAESSHHSPTSSVDSDDIDDDDEVDETHVNPVTSIGQMGAYDPTMMNEQQLYAGQQNSNYNPAQRFDQFAGTTSDAYAPYAPPAQRYRRSISASSIYDYLTSATNTATTKGTPVANQDRQKPLHRVRRHSKYIGPVYTYVKTDKSAHFKWGVKHKVGKKHHG